MGMFFFFSGLGSIFGLLALECSKSFIFSSAQNIDDINCPKCHLNYYFFILSVIQIVGMLLFIFIDRKLKLTEVRRKKQAMTNNYENFSENNLPNSVLNYNRQNSYNSS